MRLIPPYIGRGTKSWGEKRLFEDIRSSGLPDEYHIFHSINLPDHIYKTCGELDFVIVSPLGLYVLEVKGGLVSCTNGIWHYEDRYGNFRRSSEGPFKQASSGLFSLRERLMNLIPPEYLSTMVLGWGVIFPSCDFAIKGIEWDEDVILDAGRWDHQGIIRYLHALEKYWHNKFPGKPDFASMELVKDVVKLLRPDFYPVQSLRIQLDELENRLVQMTAEQYDRIEAIEHCPRILIEGGAGTGKTFLAKETAIRHAMEGKKVLFVCFSPILASFLKRQISTPGITIVSTHDLMLQVIKKHGTIPPGYFPDRSLIDPWFVEVLTPAFELASRDLGGDEQYDVLIVDEGQDILNMTSLIGLDKLVIGGLEEGIWRIFYDSYNQGAIYGAADSEAIEMLKSYGPVPPRLRINCRNTDPIVLQTKVTTGADFVTSSTGPGPLVIQKQWKNIAETAKYLEEYLDRLSADNCPGSGITILSSKSFEESSASHLSRKWLRRIHVLHTDSWDSFPAPDISFSTVAGFKGLENQFIAFIDIDDIDSSPAARAILYVGMTRARVQLWMAISDNIQKHLDEITISNLRKLTEESKNGRR